METKFAGTLLGVAIVLVAWWAFVRWSTHKLVDHLNEQAKDPRNRIEMEVKPFEIKEIDMSAWQQNFGAPVGQ